MTLVFDTTALSHFLDEDQAILQAVASKDFDGYVIPLATDAEIRFGFMHGSRQTDNLTKYSHIIEQLAFEVVYPNQDTSLIYAELATWARQHGIALSNNDIWIAATCSQLGGRLLTLDGDFKHLPHIPLVGIK
jgi:predicted nucleic acid-binding protein